MVLCYKLAVIALVCLIHSVTVFGQAQQAGAECRLPRRTGQCSQSSIRYYYNAGAGRCVRFIYTGCGGNLNNFMTKQECNSRCLCSLPVDEGTGNGRRFNRYYFNVQLQQCVLFRYRGSGGNPNRFTNVQACENRCLGNTVREQCDQRPDRGFFDGCPAKTSDQYYYDSNCNCCRRFKYYGCGGNTNRFLTHESCAQSCKRETPPTTDRSNYCYYQPLYGKCSGMQVRYYYDAEADQCRMFVYSGCGGNANRFTKLEGCSAKCTDSNFIGNATLNAVPVKPKRKGVFSLAKLLEMSGMKRDSRRDAILKLAQKSGLNGANDIDSLLKLAKQSGMMGAFKQSNRNKRITKKTTTQSPTTTTTTTTVAPTTTAAPVVPSVCLPAPDEGDCIFNLNRYYFDKDIGMCRRFNWSGCGGNSNRFYSEEHCESTCVFN